MEYVWGQHVYIKSTLFRQKINDARLWVRRTPAFSQPQVAIVLGKRALRNGVVHYYNSIGERMRSNEPYDSFEFVGRETVVCYLVCRKGRSPEYVHPDDIEPMAV